MNGSARPEGWNWLVGSGSTMMETWMGNLFKETISFKQFQTEGRFRSRSVPLGLYTLYPWTGVVVPGQFQLRSQDPGLLSAGLILRLWWLTGSGEALQPLLPWDVPLQFHSFYLTIGQQVVFQKLELQELLLSPLRLPSGQTLVGIEPLACLVKSQHFSPSWQP